ncbi:hypothetical protein A2691_01995 [Candidatus Woesebacteria bacterium RIFCSPHIGHO2_01_FULL_39_23]|nr:MAG: hypothetical protein A2691_01995 [Candidatus Woesebacteria bacterium RIFCSPHIGHO2_01_FULL_39_23]
MKIALIAVLVLVAAAVLFFFVVAPIVRICVTKDGTMYQCDSPPPQQTQTSGGSGSPGQAESDTPTWVCTQGGTVVSTVDPVLDVKTMENFQALADELNRKNGTSWSPEYAWHQQGDCDEIMK